MKRPLKNQKPLTEFATLFTEAPVENFSRNARLGGAFHNDEVLVEGFRRAGDVLVEHALEDQGSINFLACPALFNYRQFVELKLKALIAESERCYDLAQQAGAQLDALQAPVAAKLTHEHSIKRLVEYLKERVCLVLARELDSETEKLLMELDLVDPTSQAFRYVTDPKGAPLLAQEALTDLSNVRLKMRDVAGDLEQLESDFAFDRELSEMTASG